MTPQELKDARRRLGLSAEVFARTFGAHDGRTVRAWEHGERNGLPAHIPRSVDILVRLALEVREVRAWLGLETSLEACQSRFPTSGLSR